MSPGSPKGSRAAEDRSEKKLSIASAPVTAEAIESVHAMRVWRPWLPTNWLMTKQSATKLA